MNERLATLTNEWRFVFVVRAHQTNHDLRSTKRTQQCRNIQGAAKK